MRCRWTIYHLLYVICFAFVATKTSIAQTAEDSPARTHVRPAYQMYRYDEDWSVLRDKSLRTDVMDGLKYIPLKEASGWYLSLGGETRWRYENFRNPGFGFQPQDANGYLLQRHLLDSDSHFGSRARVFLEFQSAIESGREGGPRPTDENRFDIHQAFADLTWKSRRVGMLTLRAGRQEVAFGAGRLISAAEGTNVRRSFDGLRLIWNRRTWTFNSILMQLTKVENGTFDDRPDNGHFTWGFGGFGPLSNGERGNLAFYYIGNSRKDAEFQQGKADATRHSFGVRTWHVGRLFDYEEEVIVQSGSFGKGAIRAWALSSEQGFTPSRFHQRLRFGIRMFLASGDRDPRNSSLESFDPLFPGTAYSGKAALIGATNLIKMGPVVNLSINPAVHVNFDWAHFWRRSLNDGLYGANLTPLRSGLETSARDVGSQATTEVDMRLTTHFSLWTSIAFFRIGDFLKETPPAKSLRYVAAHVAYRF
jgi:Alginate export